MKFLVVLSAVCAMAAANLPAVLLDPHGRPLDTPAVVNARAIHLQAKALEGAHGYGLGLGSLGGLGLGLGGLGVGLGSGLGYSTIGSPLLGLGGAHLIGKRSLGHIGYAAPSSAITHQSRVDVISSPPVVSHAPVIAHAAPIVSHAVPIVSHAAPASAVSHQSRVDVISSPPVVSHAIHAPVIAHAAPIVSHAPIVAHAAPASAVSHQSRVDVISSPAVVSHSVAAPVYAHAAPIVAHPAPIVEHVQPIVAHAAPIVAHSVPASSITHQSRVDVSTGHDASLLGHSAVSYDALPYGGLPHYLNKRSLGHYVHAAPAVSHQARVDVISSPAVVSHAVAAPVLAHSAPLVAHAAPAVSHQSRVDVRTSHATPYLSGYGAHGGLYNSAPLINAW